MMRIRNNTKVQPKFYLLNQNGEVVQGDFGSLSAMVSELLTGQEKLENEKICINLKNSSRENIKY